MSTNAPPEKLSTHYRPIRSVSVSSIRQLYEVHAACHDNASIDVFIRELGRKSGVILMRRKSDGRIVGFAMQTFSRMNVDGRPVLGLLSDDAVVLPQYWPQAELAEAAQALMLRVKMRHPSTPLYWGQLARHPRSFLLMASQARHPYPGLGTAQAVHKRVAQSLGRQWFPEGFDNRRMLLAAHSEHALRPHEAATAIPPEMAADPRIALFKKLNPSSHRGTALLSVAEFDAQSLTHSLSALPMRWIRRHILRNYEPTGAQNPARTNSSQQQASWQDSSLDEALERGETP